MTVDRQGNVYILERSGNVLRVVDPQGKIRTVAGTGKAGAGLGGGDPRKVEFNGPKHLCVDLADNVIIADTANHRILRYAQGADHHTAGRHREERFHSRRTRPLGD